MSSIVLTPQDFLDKVKVAFKSPSQPVSIDEVIRDIMDVFSSRHHFLPCSFWPPDSSDRVKVQSKEVELRGQRFVLDDDDVVTVVRLSDCLNLNELECLRLLVHADLHYGRSRREQSDFFSRLWYMERNKLITALQTILEVIVLPRNLEQDLVASIKKCMQDLLNSGLRRQLISLMKHCYEQATTISDGSGAPSYIVDSQDVYEEWAILSHCLFLSSLVVQPSSGDLTELFHMLKDNTAALARIGDGSSSQYQVICGLLFSIITSLLPASADGAFVFPDVSSRNIFHENVMASVGDAFQDGIIACVRLAWAIHLMLIEENSGKELSWFYKKSVEIEKIESSLDIVFSNNAFQVFIDIYFKNVASEADAEDVIHLYNASLHNLIATFLSLQLFQLKVEEVVDMARMNTRCFFDEFIDLESTKKDYERANKLTVSLLQFVCEIYKAYNEKGASSVFEWVGGEICNDLSWRNFFGFLKEYSKKGDRSVTEFPEDTDLIIAFLHLLMVLLRNENVVEREQWFPDVEPLFMFLTSGKFPYELEDKVKDAINAFIVYCPKKEAEIWSYCKKYNVQVGDEGFQRGKRPRISSMEHVCDDMGQPKPKVPRQSTTVLTADCTSEHMGHSGGPTPLLSEVDSLLMSYLDDEAIHTDTDPTAVVAAPPPPITIIQRASVIID